MDIVNSGNVVGAYQYITQNRNRHTEATGFANALNSAATMDRTTNAKASFEDIWKSTFPGAKYHVMDASKISQGLWERNDFPFEKFFDDEVDDSILDWKPSGQEPAMSDSQVQARLNSTLGEKSIIVPTVLEEKMKDNPDLVKNVMDKVEDFISNHPTRPGRICSYLISLDENGNIAHFRVTGGGGNISGPSKEELRQFEAEQKAKREKQIMWEKLETERIQEASEEHQRIEMESIRRGDITSDILNSLGGKSGEIHSFVKEVYTEESMAQLFHQWVAQNQYKKSRV